MQAARIILLAAALLSILAGTARPGWYTYTKVDGLVDSQVLSMLEDRSGNIWFGGIYGLSRYDGVIWRTFTEADGLAYNYVISICEDHSGNLWFGTFRGGVSQYDGVSWRTFTEADGLADNYVLSILEDRSGALWFGTYEGLSRYDGVSWRRYTTDDGLASNTVFSILEDDSGALWFGTGAGVSRYDGVSWRTFREADGLVLGSVLSILEDRSGNLWFGTLSNGVSRYDGASWRTFTTADGLASNNVHSIVEDRSGNLWFGTSEGASRYDGVSWRTHTTADGLVADQLKSILEDHSGNLWFGTTEGVSRYDGVSWRTYATADGLVGKYVASILEDRSGGLWFGTYGAGVSWYDGVSWRAFTTADGLAHNSVYSTLEDRSGSLWFGTPGGASRYDRVSWRTYTTADGLANNVVYSLFEDRNENLWFGTYGGGVSRYDGVTWLTYTASDGLPGKDVVSILEDRSGNLWFGTYGGGVSRYDGVSFRTYTTADGLADNRVNSILEDRSGNLWFGTLYGVSRYDGASWQTYTTAEGLADSEVKAILEDRSGNLWFGTGGGGVSRYDGTNWGTYGLTDGLASENIEAMVEDRRGCLWLGSYGAGVIKHEPDRVPPQTVISLRPPNLSASTTWAITFAAAFREVDGIAFSYSFDGSSWSEWSPTNSCQGAGLADGEHVFEVKARDKIGNVDPTPAVCRFEIDAAPPVPIIRSPASDQAVRDSVVIRGTAADLRFKKYLVELRSSSGAVLDTLGESFSPVADGALAGWNTLPLPDGDYELRLSVTDTLWLTGTALVRVIVDNHEPWADQTAPAVINTSRGGDIYTTNEEVHLYFPPLAFRQDTEVGISALADSDVPDTVSNGARRVLAGYEISWGVAVLGKPATLEMSYAVPEMSLTASQCGDIQRSTKVSDEGESSPVPVTSWTGDIGKLVSEGHSPPVDGTLALYMFGSDSTWRRLGGTVDPSAERISTPISEPGRYAIYGETARVSGPPTLSDLVVTPRVFSPRGALASEEAAIGFTLGRSGPVMVKVYNRAGRLVREVASGQQMNAGANLVRWDGRDSDANLVQGGVYLVVVEALGRKEVKTLAVVR